MKKILLTNDDGIEAEGILALANALKKEYEVYVAAPSIQNSGMSHAVTYFKKDLLVKKIQMDGFDAYAVSGTPADCVYAFLYGISKDKMDLVISGINDGPNYATDIAYSGTIGAAEEAHIAGFPSLAVSLDRPSIHYETAVEITKRILPIYLNDPKNKTYICSINVPDLPIEDIRGYQWTDTDAPILYERRLVKTSIQENEFSLHCPQGLGLKQPIGDIRYDVSAVEEGYVSITPLDIDTVKKDGMDKVKVRFKNALK